MAVAVWYLKQYEVAVELILENISLNQREGKVMGSHVVAREKDLINQNPSDRLEFEEMNGELFHLLVLPKGFDLQDVKQWNEKVVRRRPDLANAYHPMLLYKN